MDYLLKTIRSRTSSSVIPEVLEAGFQEGPSMSNRVASSVKLGPGERSGLMSLISPFAAMVNFRITTARVVAVSESGNCIFFSIYCLNSLYPVEGSATEMDSSNYFVEPSG